jgi:hypothetical protein
MSWSRACAAGPGQDRHPARAVQHLSRGRERSLGRSDHRRRLAHRGHRGAGRDVGEEHLARDDDDGDPAALQRRAHRALHDVRDLLGDAGQLARRTPELFNNATIA